MNTSESIGKRVHRIRETRGITAAALGARVGVGEGAIYKLERSDSTAPAFANGIKMARALGITPEELAGLPPAPDYLLKMTAGTFDFHVTPRGQLDAGTLKKCRDDIKSALLSLGEVEESPDEMVTIPKREMDSILERLSRLEKKSKTK